MSKCIKNNKKKDEIVLTFNKFNGEFPKASYCVSINIRQSGSRIYEFCIQFKTLFKQLQTVEDKKETIKGLAKKL